MLTVVHLADTLGFGGTEKAAETFVRNHTDNIEAHLCGWSDGGVRGEAATTDGYPVVVPDDADDLAEYFREHNVDILHLHGTWPEDVLDAADAAGVEATVLMANFGWTPDPNLASRVDRFLFVSKTVLLRYLLLSGYDITGGDWPARHRHLYNPLDTARDSSGNTLREEYDLPVDAPIVGKIGRSAPEKWGRLTVAAFARVVEREPSARLLLLNAPDPIRDELRAHGVEENAVYAESLPHGEVDRFYRSVDVLAHASAIGESFGYVIAEAMAHEVPVVVDSTPMRDNAQVELVDHGETGYVANSVEAYADAILELLDDDSLRSSMGREARAKAVETYDVEMVVPQLEAEYRSLLRDHPRTETGPDYEVERQAIVDYQNEYSHRLRESYGREDTVHRAEREVWDVVGEGPLASRVAYELGRKAFIFANEYL